MGASTPALSDGLVGPDHGRVSCAQCGAVIDALRAGHVALFDARVHFFCSYDSCRQAFATRFGVRRAPRKPDRALPSQPPPTALADRLGGAADNPLGGAAAGPVRGAPSIPPPELTVPSPVRSDDQPAWLEPLPAPIEAPARAALPSGARRDLGLLLIALGLIAGALAMALELGEPTGLLLIARAVLVGVGLCALLGHALTAPRDPAEPHRLAAVIPALGAGVLAAWGAFEGDAAVAARASFLGGTVVMVAAASAWLLGMARRPIAATREWTAEQLDAPGRRVSGEPAVGLQEPGRELRPGEQLVVEVGETVPVDAELVDREVEVLPWPAAPSRLRRARGEFVVAGAQVTQGPLRGVCTWTGDERALARSLLSEPRRSDVHGRLARLSKAVAQRGSLLAAAAAALAVVATSWGSLVAIELGMVVVAVYAALGNAAVHSVAGLTVARGIRNALGRGIVFNDAEAWDRCAQVHAAVFCARGTLLRGEAELVEVEATGEKHSPEAVLALAAGALAAEQHPVAVAVRRKARQRGLRPHPVRNPRAVAGMGVAAVVATGEAALVGSRALMLERHVSVAAAEPRISSLERHGRTVLLVAKAGRLVGLLGLQDGLRAGARAAVQHLLDARVRGQEHETCEALGRSLDIEHIRPEVPDGERAAAIKRIQDTGATVAVIGRPETAEDALAAADASVALAAAGSAPDDHSVSLVSDDARDAALALALARRTQQQAAQVLGLVLGPAVLGALVVAAGLLPPEYAPLAALLGTAAAVAHLLATDRAAKRR